LKLFGKDLDTELVLVAELGVNHEGSVDAALELLRAAAGAGADAVKLQTYTPERFIASSDGDRLERVRRFSLSEDEHWRLKEEADALGVPLFSTAVSDDVVDFLARLSSVIKIASGDLDFEPVIRAAARTQRNLIVSTGMGTVDEIERTLGWLREEIGDDLLAERVALMHCVSSYPTPLDQANVRSVPFLRERFGLVVGYSNHVEGPDAALAAAALGAPLIEVHFTDRKEGRTFRDHQLSFLPDELRALKDQLLRVRAALGSLDKRPMPCERDVIGANRKGVVAARDLPVGTALTPDDVSYARPATGLRSWDVPSLIGKRLTRALKAGEPLSRDVIG
jgi:N-acetylneuraminate synthase/N,N'-diacetyllegionaminate synthase